MERLKEIVKGLQKIKLECELKKLSDDMLVDCSVRIYNSQNIQEQKLGKSEPIKPSNPAFEPATDKQKKFLQNTRYGGDIESLSKLDAIKLIDRAIRGEERTI